ncbi:methyltransferase domain-containing protein [Rhodobacterales bacterium HKCCE2091]|nr:methyltransferase domain-containing protein [Rhodobacterales bacterium HKCCE2091]
MSREAFFTLHSDLPREGPGEAADVAWAVAKAGTAPGSRVCDAAGGPGADLAALADAVPGARLTAFDLHEGFVAAAAARGTGARVLRGRLIAGGGDRLPDPVALGPFDLIWCAGAMYFEGIAACLRAWAPALAPGGAVAFTEPAWFTDDPSPAAAAMWAEYPAMTDPAGIDDRVRAAGFETVATRALGDAAWESYYTPLDARIAALRPGADADLARVLDAAETEAATWRAHRDAFGYLLSVVRAA